MRVNQKITVGTITINSVQNSSIVQIGSSGMIQSQSETYQPPANGNGAPTNGSVPKGGGPIVPHPELGTQMSPNGTPFSPPGSIGAIPPLNNSMNHPIFEGPFGPGGGFGSTRNEIINKQDLENRE